MRKLSISGSVLAMAFMALLAPGVHAQVTLEVSPTGLLTVGEGATITVSDSSKANQTITVYIETGGEGPADSVSIQLDNAGHGEGEWEPTEEFGELSAGFNYGGAPQVNRLVVFP